VSPRRGPDARQDDSPVQVEQGCAVVVDETMRKGYTMAAVYVPFGKQAELRKFLRALPRGGARTVHFAEDNDQVKYGVIRALRDFQLRATIVQAPRGRTREPPRDICLRGVARAALARRARSITFDRDDSREQQDNRVLYQELSKSDVTYQHRKSYEEPLLWLADAIAWAWHRDSMWRGRVREFVMDVVVGDE
jgi:hypothetical protein